MPIVNHVKKIASIAGPVGLAALLLFLALRGIDTSEFKETLRTANYFWLIPLVVVTLLSHWFRAMRWSIFVETIRESEHARNRPSMATMFGSLMVGYMINNVTTRLGEVVKAGVVARREKVAFSGVVGTVVSDRIIDMVVLGTALLSVLFVLRDRLHLLETSLYQPAIDRLSNIPAWIWIGTAIGMIAVIGLLFRLVRSRTGSLKRIAGDFVGGLSAVFKTGRPTFIIVLTILMWFCYVLMAYIPFLVLEIQSTYAISLLSAWVVMNIGALGIVVPAPGGIGSYHYITILILTLLYGVTRSDAAAYAFLTHGTQLVLYTITGAIFTVYFGLKWNRISGDKICSS